MERVHKFLHLSLRDKSLLVQSVFLLMTIRLGLSLILFKKILKFINRENHKYSGVNNKDRITLDRIVWAVEVGSRYIPRTTCLNKALTAQILLAKYGYQSSLHIGVAKNGDKKLDAHAWVESQGDILIGNLKDLSKFAPLLSPKKCI